MSSNKTIALGLLILAGISIRLFLGGAEHAEHSHKHSGMTAKLSAGINVEFEMLTEKPMVNQDIEVTALITSLSGSGNFDYKIFMPHNSTLSSPLAEGTIDLEQDLTKELNIVFKQSVDYDMKIHLEIRKPGSPNASMFTFSTMDFHQNKKDVEELQERQSDYAK